MKYLLTGASGFLGRHILEALPREKVVTVGRGSKNDRVCDLRHSVPDLPAADIIIHCAGKAHSVPRTPEEEEEFFLVNLEGTKNLLRGLEKTDAFPTQLVFISTVSVYGRESGKMICESHPLLGESSYALSKIQAEQILLDWGELNDVSVLILRLPLIAGSYPPGNLGKMIKGIKEGRYASIAGVNARKSMVLATDVAKLIAMISRQKGIFNLTDGYHPHLYELEFSIAKDLKRDIKIKLPLVFAKAIGIIGDVIPFLPINSQLIRKMTLELTFDDSKAKRDLNWSPNPVLSFNFSS